MEPWERDIERHEAEGRKAGRRALLIYYVTAALVGGILLDGLLVVKHLTRFQNFWLESTVLLAVMVVSFAVGFVVARASFRI